MCTVAAGAFWHCSCSRMSALRTPRRRSWWARTSTSRACWRALASVGCSLATYSVTCRERRSNAHGRMPRAVPGTCTSVIPFSSTARRGRIGVPARVYSPNLRLRIMSLSRCVPVRACARSSGRSYAASCSRVCRRTRDHVVRHQADRAKASIERTAQPPSCHAAAGGKKRKRGRISGRVSVPDRAQPRPAGDRLQPTLLRRCGLRRQVGFGVRLLYHAWSKMTTPSGGQFMLYVKSQGLRIHYHVEGHGPPLVCQHGFGDSLKSWYELGYVDALKDEYRLVLIDARGHGTSDKPHEPEA